MINDSFLRIGCASPIIRVADVEYNTKQIKDLINKAYQDNISILTFPELCLTGYTCSDLFFQSLLLKEVEKAIVDITNSSTDIPILFSIGAPIRHNGQLFNCSIIICQGKIIGIVPKIHLPNYNEFYEKRWFSSGKDIINTNIILNNISIPFGTDIIFSHNSINELKIAVEICEDLWVPIPPSSFATLSGATIILNGSGSNELVGKMNYRKQLISQQSARTVSAYAYASTGYGESTTDVVFGGHCIICENGTVLNENNRFSKSSSLIYTDIDLELLNNERIKKNSYYNTSIEKIFRTVPFNLPIKPTSLKRYINPHPFVPHNIKVREENCKEIFSIQTLGLSKRIEHIGTNKVILGISGGLDSTLALLVCVKAFEFLNIDTKNIIGVTMPGFGTTDRTYNNSIKLMQQLNITIKEISIKDACLQHFEAIDHSPLMYDLTYENCQARERTQILMDLATKENGFVVGTGDLSELALGWATYNGDHMSMYAVNASIPKTLVRYLIKWVADTQLNEQAKDTLLDILDTPVSPELLPPSETGEIKQKTEEVVGPYELHDFYLFQVMRYGFSPTKIYELALIAFKDSYSPEEILKWLKKFYYRFFSQQFKRSCLPDGPKVGSICLSPRGDWRMPSDAIVNLWIKQLEELRLVQKNN